MCTGCEQAGLSWYLLPQTIQCSNVSVSHTLHWVPQWGATLKDVEGLWDLHEEPAACYRRNWSVRGLSIWGEGVLEVTPS